MLPDMELDKSLGLTSRLGDRIQGMHDLIGLDNQILSETERLNPNGIGRIYEEQSLPEEDDEFNGSGPITPARRLVPGDCGGHKLQPQAN